MYQNLLFDLDGTLTDPGVGITNSVAYALEKFGIQTQERSQLYPFIGPPLQDSFERFYGFSQEDAKQAVGYYREYFKEKGIFENKVYDGMARLLESLCDAGKNLYVATSKPEIFAVRILDYFSLSRYFTFVAGSNLDGTRSKKEDVIAYALHAAKISDLSDVVMIGDREYDIAGAKKNGIASVGVLYGYGGRQELENAGADYIAACQEDIYRYCTGVKPNI
ncbi:5'-nucleotidase [Eubacterium plexicaudatum ASF492]|uniref:HAD hydrolase, family IA n=1 Tax=Eubacterium plexicaudatum ASF492 TaxID=1235802 RepID=N2BCX8_9FIRM|nr:5'-nucleotidase [Eubacterium plexicaudatum ASF492]